MFVKIIKLGNVSRGIVIPKAILELCDNQYPTAGKIEVTKDGIIIRLITNKDNNNVLQ